MQIDGKVAIDNGAGWHRSHGNTGWYNDTHKGGIYMIDSTYVRVYASKRFLVNNYLHVEDSNGGIQLKHGTSPGVELRSKKAGTPHVDFSNDATSDYDARIILRGNDDLAIEGADLTVNRINSASKMVQRDIWQYKTTTSGGRYIHIKTNVKFNNTMYRIEIKGYNYGRVREINNVWMGYARSNNTVIGVRHRAYDDGLYSMLQYRTSDGYLALRAYGSNVYYMGFTMNAMTLNPAGNASQVKVLTHKLTTSSGNQW